MAHPGDHPTQITHWKQELVESASDLFGKGKKKEINLNAEIAELHRQTGKLTVEKNQSAWAELSDLQKSHFDLSTSHFKHGFPSVEYQFSTNLFSWYFAALH
jgi:hypothetical protein